MMSDMNPSSTMVWTLPVLACLRAPRIHQPLAVSDLGKSKKSCPSSGWLVVVSFVVNKKGKVVNAKIEKSISPELDAEALRVVNASPDWTPGMQRGVSVNVQFTFPIHLGL